MLDLLTGLVDKSLVTTDEQGPEARYRLLETVRQYGAARLTEADEVIGARDAHLAYHLALAERAEPRLIGAGRGDPVLQGITAEVPNLRAAVDWAAATNPPAGLRVVSALTLFWLFTGRYREGDATYARALDAAGEQHTVLCARALAGRANLAMYGGNEAAAGWAQAALETGQACGDLQAQGRALDTLGLMVGVGDPAGGRPLLERSVELATQAGDDWCRIDAAQCLAICWGFQDEFDAARPIIEQAHADTTRLGYRWGLAWHGFLLGWEAALRGQLQEARNALAHAVAASDEIGNPITDGYANSLIAYIDLLCGHTEQAHSLAGATLRRSLETGAALSLGMANQMMGRTKLAVGELTAAREHLLTAVAVERPSEFAYLLTWHLSVLGTLERIEGNIDAARGHGAEALQVAQRIGSGWMQAHAECLLGRVALTAGEAKEAERFVHDALGRLVSRGFAVDIPECLDSLAAIATAAESFEEAGRLLGAAAAGRERLGSVRFPPEPEFWTGVERATRKAVGDDVYESAFAAGAAMETDEAVAYARRARGERKRPSSGWDSLTPTELAVVRHVTAGLTNRHIGERMFITPGTVKVHLAHIFSKLGISSRSQLAAEAATRGLGPGAVTDIAKL